MNKREKLEEATIKALQNKLNERLTEALDYSFNGRGYIHSKSQFLALSKSAEQLERAEQIKKLVGQQGLNFESCKVYCSGSWGVINVETKLAFKNDFNEGKIILEADYRIQNDALAISDENPAVYEGCSLIVKDKNNNTIDSISFNADESITDKDILDIVMILKNYMLDKDTSDSIDKENSDNKFWQVVRSLAKYTGAKSDLFDNEEFRNDLNTFLNKYINK